MDASIFLIAIKDIHNTLYRLRLLIQPLLFEI